MKYIFTILLLFTIAFTDAQAQKSAEITANIGVKTTMVQTIELITVNTMTFGRVRPGQTELYVNPIMDTNAGFMIAIGTPRSEFRLDYNEEVTLTNQQETGTLTFVYEISRNNIEEQATSIIIENQDEVQRFHTEGRFYFWVGGRVNLENAAPGNYRGEFKIEIDYI